MVRKETPLEGENPRHQRQAADRQEADGEHFHGAHGCFSFEAGLVRLGSIRILLRVNATLFQAFAVAAFACVGAAK